MKLSSLYLLLVVAPASTQRVPCEDNNDCLNAGQCQSGTCDCTSAYTGVSCEIECDILCYNDGECRLDISEHGALEGMGADEFSCECKDEWGGFNCNFPVETCPDGLKCQNEGICRLLEGNVYQCECTDAFDGSVCQNPKNPPTESPTEGCSICGDGLVVTRPDVIFAWPDQPQVACGVLEEAGNDGLIPLDQCIILPDLVADDCGCQNPSSSPIIEGSLSTDGGGLSPGAIAGIIIATVTVVFLALLVLCFKISGSKKERMDTKATPGVVEEQNRNNPEDPAVHDFS